jgi:hypothetical protein
MSLRIAANLSPRQSPSSAILRSMRSDALARSDDLAAARRGPAAFLATRADSLDVFLAIAFIPSCLQRPVMTCRRR